MNIKFEFGFLLKRRLFRSHNNTSSCYLGILVFFSVLGLFSHVYAQENSNASKHYQLNIPKQSKVNKLVLEPIVTIYAQKMLNQFAESFGEICVPAIKFELAIDAMASSCLLAAKKGQSIGDFLAQERHVDIIAQMQKDDNSKGADAFWGRFDLLVELLCKKTAETTKSKRNQPCPRIYSIVTVTTTSLPASEGKLETKLEKQEKVKGETFFNVQVQNKVQGSKSFVNNENVDSIYFDLPEKNERLVAKWQFHKETKITDISAHHLKVIKIVPQSGSLSIKKFMSSTGSSEEYKKKRTEWFQAYPLNSVVWITHSVCSKNAQTGREVFLVKTVKLSFRYDGEKWEEGEG